MAVIDELLVGLGFEYDPKEAKKFKDDIGKTVKVVKRLAQVAVGAATAISAMTIASARATDETGKLADEIGETVENVSALQFAQKIAGGTADGMASSLRTLSLRASEAARGTGSGVEAFGLLGISVTDANGKLKSASNLMQEVSTNMQGLDRARQIELADKLGLRDSIRLLQDGPRAMRELIAEGKELGNITGEDAAIAEDFNDSLVRMWTVIKQVSRVITRSLAPITEGMITRFTDWWKINRQLIEQNIPEWIDSFTKALKILSIAMGAFIALKILTHLMALIALLKGVTLATLAMNVALFLLPALLLTIATAFVALMEDAKVFFEGGESFIGDMIEKYPEWEKQITSAGAAMATVWDTTAMIWEGWKGIIELMGKFSKDNAKEVLDNLPGFLGDITGLSTIEGTGFIPETKQSLSNAYTTTVDRLEIIVNGGIDSAQNIANEVWNVFQQTSQELNTTVDQ